ncbi:MAG: MerR family transcriptional regulator [Nitrospinota bacterium]|nr:MerR family transcriptional regulator [Nitrospinota bacterium]
MNENGKVAADVEIPDKMFFKIREVAQIVGVKPHVLRYWETEFTSLAPRKNRNGQRLYTRKDVQGALEIRRLLHVEKFSIAGARQKLKKRRDPSTRKKSLQGARDDLAEILRMLEKDGAERMEGSPES